MDNWVDLIVTYDEIEVQLIKNILEAEGIQVVVNSLKVRPYPVSIGKIGEVRLLVKDTDLDKARNVIEIMKGTAFEKETDDN